MDRVSSLKELEQFAKAELCDAGVENFENEARWIIAETLGISTGTLLMRASDVVAPPQLDSVLKAIQRRSKGEPLSYVLGTADFRGRDFWVDAAVLIPRPETEQLVDIVGATLQGNSRKRCLEIGVGSGCIAVSLLLEHPELTMVATDISEEALKVCERNAATHNVGDRLKLIHGSVTSGVVEEPFDWVISNPPYIAHDDERVASDVRQFEPAIALFADKSGMAVIEAIATEACRYLAPQGHVIVEHGDGQSESVVAEFAKQGFATRTHIDVFGKLRFVEGWLNSRP